MPLRIALAGGSPLARSLAEPIVSAGHELAAVILDGRKPTPPFIRLMEFLAPNSFTTAFARMHKIPIFRLSSMGPAELEPLRALDLDLILVGGFGIIFKRPILDLPRLGCVNCHSSLLPKHRGPNPFSAVILAGEEETGVTFHIMTEGIDDGDILAQKAFPLSGTETAGVVFNRCAECAGGLVADMLEKVVRAGLAGTPQDPARASYDAKLTEEDLRLDWRRPAADLVRLVRAGWPFSPAVLDTGRGKVHVRRARALAESYAESPGRVLPGGPGLRIATGEGVFSVEAALTPWGMPWPAPWNRPKPGRLLP